MQTKHTHLAALAAAGSLVAFAAGAQAQVIDQTDPSVVPDNSGNTIIIVTPPEDNGATPGSTAVFTPLADDQPATRADVKAEARAAVRNGGIPRGELGPADMAAHAQPPVEPYDATNNNVHRP